MHGSLQYSTLKRKWKKSHQRILTYLIAEGTPGIFFSSFSTLGIRHIFIYFRKAHETNYYPTKNFVERKIEKKDRFFLLLS